MLRLTWNSVVLGFSWITLELIFEPISHYLHKKPGATLGCVTPG
jgi:hypothetical protein